MQDNQLASLLQTYQTPFYLFDVEQVACRIRTMRTFLPPNIALCYAMKANPFLTGEVSGLVERLEICSPGEYMICETLGLPSEQFVISGVYKDPAWIRDLVQNGPQDMIYTVESAHQFELLLGAARDAERPLSLLLRLTSGNQFGLDRETLTWVMDRCADEPLITVRGIQYFSGTQKSSCKRLQRELAMLDAFLAELEEKYGAPLPELEIGPGFPVRYFADDADSADILPEACTLLAGMRFQGRIILELGRSIAAGCGRYFTRVVDQKINAGQRYAIVDGGMHHLVYYGQSMAMRRPQVQVFPPRPAGDERWNICGALCTTNDILVKQLPLDGLQIGDTLIFENAGAYCMTEGIALFLSRDLPAILLRFADGRIVCVRDSTQTCYLNTPNYEK